MSNFIIDINEIERKGDRPVEIEGVVAAGDCEATVKLSGIAKPADEGGVYSFSGRLQGFLSDFCSRCLEPVSIPYDAEIEFRFSDDESQDDEEILAFQGGSVDLLPVIKGTILADKPISILCREDCKGLCQVCGRNLNNGCCGCLKELINPVIDKSFFQNLE